jgi:phospholipid/cholesterol/gamma-HCH transport system substrate-binding protein
MPRNSRRELRAGLVVVAAVAGYMGLVSLAGGGPGFLAPRRSIDVIFRDGQGVRVGSPVRVAGIDAGRVTAVDLKEVDGILRARVRLSVTAELASRLKQDVKVTIQSGLTGTPCVNVVSSGASGVALVPGQVVQGVESSFFDPVLEQVGLGPVERSHLSHTIAEVRKTVDETGPRLKGILAQLQDAASGLRETSDTVRPAIESAVGRVEHVAQTIDEAKLDQTIRRVDALLADVGAVVSESRPMLGQTLTNVRDLTGRTNQMVAAEGPKVSALLTGLGTTRTKVDTLVGQATVLSSQGIDLLATNRASLDRTMTNVKDTTDYGLKLVQKLYANPFYLSPFYKPTAEDIRAQEFYDLANQSMTAARELNDAVSRLQAVRTGKNLQQMTPDELKNYNLLFDRAYRLQAQLEQASRQLSEGLRDSTRR